MKSIGNGRSVVTNEDNGRSRMENKRIYGNKTYNRHNWGMYADERRKPTWAHNVCQLMKEHVDELKDDPERLSTEFIMGLTHSLKKD